MYFLCLVLVLIFYNGQNVADSDVTKDLLKVTSGSGVSFIDLWNLEGKNVGSKTDPVYRNGLIDREYSARCLLQIYFQVKLGSDILFNIKYIHPDTSASLSTWIEKSPAYVQHSIQINTVTLKLSPENGVDFWLKNSRTGNYYVTILFDRTHSTGPTFYYSGDNVGYTDLSSGNCDTSAPSGNEGITVTEAKNQLYPTPGSEITTYPPQVTATDESSTESPEMSTSMTDTSSTEKTETSTFVAEQLTLAADQLSTVKTGISTPTTNTPPSDTTTSQVSQSPNKGTTDETVKMCPCSCEFKVRLDMLYARSNLSLEELRKQMQPELDEIKRRYTWDKTKTSAFKRKKISAADKRKSSEQIGIVAGSFIAVVVGLVIFIDVIAIKRHVGVFRRHFWGEETRPDEEAELVDTRKKKSKMKKEKKQKSKQ